jgi:secondary thiamine-phosphate synthase enzyme
MWIQKELSLEPRSRGFHLIDSELLRQLPELRQLKVGLMHLQLLHTSASITLNENADPSVRNDFEQYFNRAVPELADYFEHVDEGPDDMPAHLKASLLGTSLTLPIRDGRLQLGIWQGVYLGEHRNHTGSRRLLVTLNGEV